MFTRHFEVLFKGYPRRKPSVKITNSTNDLPQKLRNLHLSMNTWTTKRKWHLAVHFYLEHLFLVVQKFSVSWGEITLHSLFFTLSVKKLEHEVLLLKEKRDSTSLLSYCETQKHRFLLLH